MCAEVSLYNINPVSLSPALQPDFTAVHTYMDRSQTFQVGKKKKEKKGRRQKDHGSGITPSVKEYQIIVSHNLRNFRLH